MIEIKNTEGEVLYATESVDGVVYAVVEALENGVDLTGADLRGAYLMGCFVDGTLRGADLRGADLRSARFELADISGADLRGAQMRGCQFHRLAQIAGANLEPVKLDLFKVLEHARGEVPALLSAVREGRIDGSTYLRECACLVGTIANHRGCNYRSMPGIDVDRYRPIEQFVGEVRPGDTPENSQFSAQLEAWLLEWLEANPPADAEYALLAEE